MEETKERNMDLRSSKPDRRHKRDPRIRAEKKKATNHDRERSERKTISDERIKSGAYQVRPGERICKSYRLTGLCEHGSNCLFNHPTCKFFRRGICQNDSACKFIHAKNTEAPRLPNAMRQALSSNVKNLAVSSHPKDRDGAEPMRQGSRRHETESAYRPEEKKYNRSLSQISVGMMAGSYKEKEQGQALDNPQEQKQKQRDITECQRYNEMGRKKAQELVQQRRLRDVTECQIDFDMGRREAQENVQEDRQRRDTTGWQRYYEMGMRDAQVIVQQHRQRDIITESQRYFEMGMRDAQVIVQQHRQKQRLMVTNLNGRFDESRHETESSSMAAKREELFTSLQSGFKDVTDDIAVGYKRMGIEHVEGSQRVEAEEIVQEQRNRQNSRRQAQENMEILEGVWRNEELGVNRDGGGY